MHTVEDRAVHPTNVPFQESTSTNLVILGKPLASATYPSEANLSTTLLGLLRGAGGPEDSYDPGTLLERAYMRSLKIEKLGSAVILDAYDGDGNLATATVMVKMR